MHGIDFFFSKSERNLKKKGKVKPKTYGCLYWFSENFLLKYIPIPSLTATCNEIKGK